MPQTVNITITNQGLDTGNFFLTALDNAGALVSGWEKTAQTFVTGTPKQYTDVPDAAYQIKIQSVTSYCSNFIILRFKTI